MQSIHGIGALGIQKQQGIQLSEKKLYMLRIYGQYWNKAEEERPEEHVDCKSKSGTRRIFHPNTVSEVRRSSWTQISPNITPKEFAVCLPADIYERKTGAMYGGGIHTASSGIVTSRVASRASRFVGNRWCLTMSFKEIHFRIGHRYKDTKTSVSPRARVFLRRHSRYRFYMRERRMMYLESG